jgi:hypothetical protein
VVANTRIANLTLTPSPFLQNSANVDISRLTVAICWSPEVIGVVQDVVGNQLVQLFHHVNTAYFPPIFPVAESATLARILCLLELLPTPLTM